MPACKAVFLERGHPAVKRVFYAGEKEERFASLQSLGEVRMTNRAFD